MDAEENLKIGKIFTTLVLNLESKKIERMYYKILSIRKDRCGCILGFKVQRCEYKKIKTVIEAVDDFKDKKFCFKDLYELKPTEDASIYYKYIFTHWSTAYKRYVDRILEDHELTKTMQRK